jgi:hypothetical protein
MVYRQGGRLVILQLRINQDFLKLAENGDFWVQNHGWALPNINTAEGMMVFIWQINVLIGI